MALMSSSVIIAAVVLSFVVGRFVLRKITGKGASSKEIDPLLYNTTHGQITFRYQPPRHHKGREVEAPFVEISVPAKSGGAFSLWSRTTVGKALTAMGFYPPIESESWGDPSGLLAAYVFAAADREGSLRLLAGQRSRTALKALADIGFTRFDHDGESIKARLMPFRTDPHPDHLPFLADAARAMHDWAALIRSGGSESMEGSQARYLRLSRLFGQKSFMGLLIAGFIGGFLAAIFLSSSYSLVEYMPFLRTWMTATLICSGLYLWKLRAIARSVLIEGQTLVTLLILPLLVFGAFLWMALSGVNGALDHSAVFSKTAPILDARRSRTKHGYTYTLEVQSWKNPAKTFDVKVPYELYERAVSGGANAELQLKKGRLGWEWIVDKNVSTSRH